VRLPLNSTENFILQQGGKIRQFFVRVDFTSAANAQKHICKHAFFLFIRACI